MSSVLPWGGGLDWPIGKQNCSSLDLWEIGFKQQHAKRSVFPTWVIFPNQKTVLETVDMTGYQHFLKLILMFLSSSNGRLRLTVLSASSIGSQNGACVGASSSAQSYCNYCKMKTQNNKWSALIINCQFGASVVQQVSPHGRKTQTAAVVSQKKKKNNRSHVRKPPRRPRLPHRPGGDFSHSLMWKHLHHKLSCPGAVRKPETHKYHKLSSGGQSWSVVPPPRSEEKKGFLMCRAG